MKAVWIDSLVNLQRKVFEIREPFSLVHAFQKDRLNGIKIIKVQYCLLQRSDKIVRDIRSFSLSTCKQNQEYFRYQSITAYCNLFLQLFFYFGNQSFCI
jgi:hypothetical protein